MAVHGVHTRFPPSPGAERYAPGSGRGVGGARPGARAARPLRRGVGGRLPHAGRPAGLGGRGPARAPAALPDVVGGHGGVFRPPGRLRGRALGRGTRRGVAARGVGRPGRLVGGARQPGHARGRVRPRRRDGAPRDAARLAAGTGAPAGLLPRALRGRGRLRGRALRARGGARAGPARGRAGHPGVGAPRLGRGRARDGVPARDGWHRRMGRRRGARDERAAPGRVGGPRAHAGHGGGVSVRLRLRASRGARGAWGRAATG
jgi:hypothetical protein